MENFIQYTPILLAIVGLIVMYIQSVWVRKQPAGTDKMQSISKSIKEGALAFYFPLSARCFGEECTNS